MLTCSLLEFCHAFLFYTKPSPAEADGLASVVVVGVCGVRDASLQWEAVRLRDERAPRLCTAFPRNTARERTRRAFPQETSALFKQPTPFLYSLLWSNPRISPNTLRERA